MGLFRNISHVLAALFNDRAEFHRCWKMAAPDERWDGDWVSQATGHRGALKCVLKRKEAGVLDASFHAVYGGFLAVCYTVPLRAVNDAGKIKLEGETDLGSLAGGVYRYTGEINDAAFTCKYSCKYDHGIFQLAPLRR